MFQSLMIKHRIWLLVLLSVLAMVVVSSFALWRSEVQIVAEKKQATAKHTESAVALIEAYYEKFQNGELSEIEAKTQAKFAVQSLATGPRSYFYMYHDGNFMVMHPLLPGSVYPDSTQADIIASTESNRLRTEGIRDEKRVAEVDPTPLDILRQTHPRTHEGFIEYLYTSAREEGKYSLGMPDAADIHPEAEQKIVYGKPFEPWDYYVLTGIYLDDVQAALMQWIFSVAAIVTVMIIALILVSYAITRSITKPMANIVQIMEDISQGTGDLTARLNEEGNNELSAIGKGFNVFVGKLSDIMQQILKSNAELRSQSEILSEKIEGSAYRSQGQLKETELLASSATELSASFSEVAANAEGSVNSAEEAQNLTETAKVTVNNNRESVERLSQSLATVQVTMNAMQEQNAQVNTVLEVIRGIAEQTNLLALNAAIEAARAGEQGRGFAVVADEVRNLAQKTRDATTDINVIIESLNEGTDNAVSAMENGLEDSKACVESASSLDGTLQSVIDAVQTIVARSKEIAGGVQQQSQVTEEIAQSSVKIADGSSQTTADSESCRESTNQMNANIDRLDSMIKKFKV
ncbi:MAG: methyl-accepting chemotaxis protein [Pseudohongiellaceae bacterium]|nr:methyl-accepting chemotaxis protein [Pseudohongiellaceae bacterium]